MEAARITPELNGGFPCRESNKCGSIDISAVIASSKALATYLEPYLSDEWLAVELTAAKAG
jgi:hypothetical protein